MGERKVLNKYLPPDFDPSLVPRTKKPKDGMVSVRMMLPFSIQCSNCNSFLYRGRKFNSKKENVEGPDGKYLGIQRFRFYIKCTACSRPITFLTDPKNADYEMENGATRNYELKKDQTQSEEKFDKEKDDEEKEAPLKALENRVLASQLEMQEMDALEEIKAMNMRHLQLLAKNKEGGFGQEAKAVLEAIAVKERQLIEEELNERGLTEDDEALVKSIQFGKQPTEQPMVRLSHDDERKSEEQRSQQAMMFQKQFQENNGMAAPKKRMPGIQIKRKRPEASPVTVTTKSAEEKKVETSALNLLGGYGSDSTSE